MVFAIWAKPNARSVSYGTFVKSALLDEVFASRRHFGTSLTNRLSNVMKASRIRGILRGFGGRTLAYGTKAPFRG
mgnify:CR=1 FL=1